MANGQLTKGVELYMATIATPPTPQSFVAGDKVANLQNFPDLIGTPSTIDLTTLDSEQVEYILGLPDVGGLMSFTFLYDKTVYKTFDDAKGIHKAFQVKFPDGVTFSWTGYVIPSVIGKGANDALQFNANISADSKITVGYPA